MLVIFSPHAWAEFRQLQTEAPELALKLGLLIDDIRRHPFQGLGKPEPLRHDLKGWWSRRIMSKNRLVYRVVGSGSEQRVEIALCRYHYG